MSIAAWKHGDAAQFLQEHDADRARLLALFQQPLADLLHGGRERARHDPAAPRQYLRVLAEETKRVASHLFNIAIFAHNVGFKSLFLHIMEVRENMQDVKETIYGNRMNLSANCIGGVKFDMDDGLTMYMLERLGIVEEAVKRVEKVFRTDPLIAKRSPRRGRPVPRGCVGARRGRPRGARFGPRYRRAQEHALPRLSRSLL